jgi:uncharacterized protein
MTHAGPSSLRPQIYTGDVVHMRLRPKPHRLAYRVFSLLTDVDTLPETARELRLFSYNRTNVFAVFDADHGPGDGTPLKEHTRAALSQAGLDAFAVRVMMLAYPRVAGATFNPLTVYYGFDAVGHLGAIIYEVNNTVGERTSYVVAAGPALNGVHAQACDKLMYVSPFTPAACRYGFRITPPGAEALVGVQVADAGGALLRTHFRGTAVPLTDRQLGKLAIRYPMLAVKVAAFIHLDALRLYLKGVPLVRRHTSPRYSVAVIDPLRVVSVAVAPGT